MNTITETTAPRIYVACLASYNSGRLHGAWIDCDGGETAIWQGINDMLAKSPFPNVQRRRCNDCEHVQADRGDDDACDQCGGDLSKPFASAEEWAVHDHEGFCGMIRTEWPDIGEVAALAEILAEDDDDKTRGLIWLVDSCGWKIADAIDKCEDVRTYDGEAKEYAAEFIDEVYWEALKSLPDLLRYHIDYEGIARDMILGGDIAEVEQGGDRFLVTNASEF